MASCTACNVHMDEQDMHTHHRNADNTVEQVSMANVTKVCTVCVNSMFVYVSACVQEYIRECSSNILMIKCHIRR